MRDEIYHKYFPVKESAAHGQLRHSPAAGIDRRVDCRRRETHLIVHGQLLEEAPQQRRGERRLVVVLDYSTEFANGGRRIGLVERFQPTGLVLGHPGRRLDVVAFQLFRLFELAARLADHVTVDNVEKELTGLLILQVEQPRVVIGVDFGRRKGNERGATDGKDRHDGLEKELLGNVRGLIDDDQIGAKTAGRLRGEKTGESETEKTRKKRGGGFDDCLFIR